MISPAVNVAWHQVVVPVDRMAVSFRRIKESRDLPQVERIALRWVDRWAGRHGRKTARLRYTFERDLMSCRNILWVHFDAFVQPEGIPTEQVVAALVNRPPGVVYLRRFVTELFPEVRP